MVFQHAFHRVFDDFPYTQMAVSGRFLEFVLEMESDASREMHR